VWSVAAAFDRAANGTLPASYPEIPASTGVRTIPPSVLKAVGWVESGWRQFTPSGRPLLSFDFGYGVMQITSGMAGAFGNASGTLDPETQSMIASSFTYNIAYGARMLAEKWASTPRVGDADPTAVENWYYALWAYNGWGWVNNPNNPRFTRQGTPATNPSTYPYQERVLYLVAHPPKDSDGTPLWQPVPVTLPARSAVSKSPKQLALTKVHHQPPVAMSALYRPAPVPPLPAGRTRGESVTVVNTGTQIWDETLGLALTYHVLTAGASPWQALSPFTPGVIAFGQGATPLTGTVRPGQSRKVSVSIQAPSTAGQYQIVWDLESKSAWLSASGILPRAQKLTVLRAGQAVPSATPGPTAQPRLALDLSYVADTSVPDGAMVATGKRFTKGWLVFNPGLDPWGSGLKLNLVSGNPFGARHIPLPSVGACRAANLLVSMKAPTRTGRYRSVWQLTRPGGQKIGDPLTLVVTVTSTRPPHPTPTPGAPTPTATTTRPTPSPTAEG
jgi:hypothetical protein